MGNATKIKKAGIFDPYLDTLGGGERYMMTIACCLVKRGWQVDVFWSDERIRNKIQERLGINLRDVNFTFNIFKLSFLQKLNLMRNYDLIFFLSDGSIPFLAAKKNILHFQVPFKNVGGRKLLNKVKLKRIDTIICNSYFTKKFIDKEYGTKSKVIYPPVPVEEFNSEKKKDIILSVGRFSRLMQSKRQDILVEAFKKIARELKNWRLILAGGTDVGKDKSYENLKKRTKGLPIDIIENPPFSQLKTLYGQAKIFWTAAGFGVEEEKNPEKVEHFGITTVEAMAAGCVPIVICKGGQLEIVNHNQNGLLWRSKEELIKQTLRVIKNDKLRERLSCGAKKRAWDFSQKKFCYEIQKII